MFQKSFSEMTDKELRFYMDQQPQPNNNVDAPMEWFDSCAYNNAQRARDEWRKRLNAKETKG